MTVDDMKRLYEALDEVKYQLWTDGIAFNFQVQTNDGKFFHTGIGSDEMMCRVILRLLVDTFKMSRLESATEFMDAIRDSFLDVLKDDDKTDYWDDECQILEESDGEQE